MNVDNKSDSSYIDQILYSRDFNMAVRNEVNTSLFYQWILDLICLTEALYDNYDRWYQQLFYVKLVEIFVYNKDAVLLENLIEDASYRNTFCECVNEILKNLTEDEFKYIIYRRHSVAHILQNGYDLYDNAGKRLDETTVLGTDGMRKRTDRFNLSRAIQKVISSYTTEQDFEVKLIHRLYPIIEKLQLGLDEQIKRHQVLCSSLNK